MAWDTELNSDEKQYIAKRPVTWAGDLTRLDPAEVKNIVRLTMEADEQIAQELPNDIKGAETIFKQWQEESENETEPNSPAVG